MKEKEIKEVQPVKKLFARAKKDFRITQNEYDRLICVGDDLQDIPEIYWENLKTEGVV